MKYKLALAIPTYNRASILRDNLLIIKNELTENKIPVYILDDSNNEDTAKTITKLREDTGIEIHYTRNTPALRHDKNIIATLSAPTANYVWLLGDSLQLAPNAIKQVLAALDDQDFIFLNCRDNKSTPNRNFSGSLLKIFLTERTWDLSFTGATIYSQRTIAWWKGISNRAIFRNFPQLSVILGYICSNPSTTADWLGSRFAQSHPRKTSSYWAKDALDVWTNDWHAVISAHPDAFLPNRLSEVIRSHSKNSLQLSAKHLLVLKGSGLLTKPDAQNSWPNLAACASSPPWLLKAIIAMPTSFAKYIIDKRPRWKERYLPSIAQSNLN